MNACLSNILSGVKAPCNSDKKAQITAIAVGILVGLACDYLLETYFKQNKWYIDSLSTSGVSMSAVSLTHVALGTFRHCCKNSGQTDPLCFFVAREVLWELLGFIIGLGIGFILDGLLELSNEKLSLSISLTPLFVAPVRTLLRNTGFFCLTKQNCCKRSDEEAQPILAPRPSSPTKRGVCVCH